MAVGRLTALASQVTLASSSSASVTVPNDGTVAAGDLLLVGCVMPSGSRTFAISGGAGPWTSLGSAAQAGHTSQTWWRIAEAGDLGATITVTPSSSGIRQVLLLGSVPGADQAAPVFGANSSTTTSTVKTTPTVASVPAGCREVSLAWDSRGASTPNTATWTAPAGQTRQLQASTTDGSGACSGAMGDSDTTVSGTVGARDWTPDQPAIGSAWTIAVAEGVTGQTINPARIEPAAVLHTPTLTPGPVTLTPDAIAPGTAVHTPNLTPGEATITPARIETAAGLYAPTLTPGPVTLNPARIEPGTALHAPTLTSGTVLTPDRIEPTATLYTPGVTPGTVTLAPARIEPTTVLHTPTLTGGEQVEDDLDITIGRSYARWTAGEPHVAWTAGSPRTGWEVGDPWL